MQRAVGAGVVIELAGVQEQVLRAKMRAPCLSAVHDVALLPRALRTDLVRVGRI